MSFSSYQSTDPSSSFTAQNVSFSSEQYPPSTQQLSQVDPLPVQPLRPKHSATGRIRENLGNVDAASCVTQQIASAAMKRFLTTCLKAEGFLTAEPDAMLRLETEVQTFVQQIFGRAKAYSEVAARPNPTTLDAVCACLEYDFDVEDELWKIVKKRSNKRKRVSRPAALVAPRGRSPSPVLLSSDDESTDLPSISTSTLNSLPSHLPSLPPKHTYLRTPAPPPKKQALPTLEKKLENASLVQNSLKNLLTLTEDGTDQNDGELFGGVVNWEATKASRRKWKIGATS